MSGGVDSSVAAWLLRQAGHEVVGLFMRHGHQETNTCSTSPSASPRKQGCCSASDAADARRVAERLGIPFYAINFQEEFGRIIQYFISEYTSGRTPNPCVVCNTWLKFGKLVDYADSVGAGQIATGHYARLLQTSDGRLALCRGLDPGKDQSYVLWGIRPEILASLQFPVGDYQKDEIRRIADRLGLHHVAEKPDSQEICFVPDQDHARFIRENRPPQDTSGADSYHGWAGGRAARGRRKVHNRTAEGPWGGDGRTPLHSAHRRLKAAKWFWAPRTNLPGENSPPAAPIGSSRLSHVSNAR